MKAYCLYCKTGSEEKLIALLKADLRTHFGFDIDMLYPKRIMNQRKKGVWSEVEQPILPGYLFLYIPKDLPFPLFIIRQEQNAYKILRYSDGTMSLKFEDEHYANWVLKHNGIFVPSTVVFEKGQKIRIIDGPLQDLKGEILKVDRHHKRAIVTIMFAGALRKIHLSVNILDTDGKESAQ
ncbi:MAG: KOW motif-containing protein [Sphaerochaetaceae bacterium]|jgi:transcriptional antiterminator NusG